MNEIELEYDSVVQDELQDERTVCLSVEELQHQLEEMKRERSALLSKWEEERARQNKHCCTMYYGILYSIVINK